jgi:hypothetical protein
MIMKNRLLLIVILSFIASTTTFAQSANSVINKYIASQATDGAVEYKKARIVVYGDVNGDKKKDAIVQYTLEGFGGGNSWGQSLAVFINTGKTYKFLGEEVVGGKFAEYTSTLKSVANNQINLITETCAEPPQGLCENPKKGKAVFVVKNGKLKGI